MAVPEQAAANTAVQQAYGDAPATADSQKAALLQAIAQAGAAGQKAVQAQQGQIGRERQNALGQLGQAAGVPTTGAFAQQLQGTVTQPFNAGEWATAATKGTPFYEGMGKLGADYMGALKSAIPINQEWTQRQANSLAAKAAREREAHAMDMERLRMARDSQRQETAMKVPVKLPDGRTIMVSPETALGHYDRSATGADSKSPDELYLDRSRRVLGNLGTGSAGRAVAEALAGGGGDPSTTLAILGSPELQKKYRTPAGRPLDWEWLTRVVLGEVFGDVLNTPQ